MTKTIEQELKLRLAEPGAWDSLMASPTLLEAADTPKWSRELLEARYFDTPSGALKAAKLAYRVRFEGGRWMATIKGGGSAEGGLHQRREWAVEVNDGEPRLEPFSATEIGPLLKDAVGEESLVPLFITRFERYSLNIGRPDGSRVEVAADRGDIVAGGQQAPILEVELELKSGNPSALLALGADLARELPLLPEEKSKYYRGLLLAGLAEEDAAMPGLPSFDGSEPAAEALQKLCISLLHRIVFALEQFILCPDDPETLHQVRVNIRRLRSALSFGKPLLPEASYDEKQEILRSWAGDMGELRDIDVAFDAWQELIRYYPTGEKLWLGEILAEERKELVRRLQTKVLTGIYTSLILEFWAWLEEDGFQSSAQDNPSIDDFATERLARWLKNIRKAGKETDLNDPAQVHRLRIQGKKLRYNLEAFSLADSKTRKLILRLKSLQDSLGLLRDGVIIINKLDQLTKERSSRAVQREAGMLKGWQLRAAFDVRARAERYWKRFRRAAREW